METDLVLDQIIAEAERALSEITAVIAAHTAARATAQGNADQAQQALAGAEQALASAVVARDHAAGQIPPLAQQLANAQAAHAQAAQAVADHDANMPEPPEPNPKGVISATALARYKAALKAWQEQRAVLVAAEQAAAGAVANARTQLEAAQAAHAAQQANVTAQQATRDSAAAAHAAALSALASEDLTLQALAPEQARRRERRDYLRRLVATVEADPFVDAELRTSAEELLRYLWNLRRNRATHQATRAQLENEIAERRRQEALIVGQFDALRVELDAEFAFKRSDTSPEQVAVTLDQAIAASQQRVATASQRLDRVAQQVAEHGAS